MHFDQEEVGDKSKETAPESKLQQVCFNRLAKKENCKYKRKIMQIQRFINKTNDSKCKRKPMQIQRLINKNNNCKCKTKPKWVSAATFPCVDFQLASPRVVLTPFLLSEICSRLRWRFLFKITMSTVCGQNWFTINWNRRNKTMQNILNIYL